MSALVRCRENPILTRATIPDVGPHLVDVTSVFNPGAARFGGTVVLLLRVQNRGRETYLMVAESNDGVRFVVRPESVRLAGLEQVPGRIHHVYDPRITRLGKDFYIVLAVDVDETCRLGLARTRDFTSFDFLGMISADDSRNGVLFPEPISGRFMMLERPNLPQAGGGPLSGDSIVISASSDLLRWERLGVVTRGRWHYWDERIGPGTPPVKTRDGWLLFYHGIATHFASVSIYQAGLLLLDLDQPSRVVARTRYNVLEPREPYETCGQVPNVVFPSGWVVDDIDPEGFARPESPVFLYYGAADTSVGLATSTIGALLSACREGE
jgi:beta-1,4-mannooligosaccharide/beta-1,4-mannosyl-N-acetylglucosamine phosphorylase